MKEAESRSGLRRALLLATLGVVGAAALHGDARKASPANRSFEIKEDIVLKDFPAGSKTARIWLPLASSDEHQRVDLASSVGPAGTERLSEPEYGNEELFSQISDPSSRPVLFELVFRATRDEYSRNPSASAASAAERPAGIDRFLRPDRLVPIDGKFRQLSGELTASKSSPAAKARAIYDYVFKTMKYDKTGEGWGRGDSLWACDSKRGNCTDFHSVFISLMRSAGIPARFEIGFPIGESPLGDIAGYHCWAEFYLDGTGWVPVDISEAWKAPAKRDYFFGSLDANRIRLSTGRDLTLNPRQEGPPLNFFVYPYVEVDGKAFEGKIERKISYVERPATSSD